MDVENIEILAKSTFKRNKRKKEGNLLEKEIYNFINRCDITLHTSDEPCSEKL